MARCGVPVPERLCGGLKPPQAPTCHRRDKHKRHKAERRLRGVGTTYWEWKTPDVPATVTGAPLVVVETKAKTWAPREATTHPKCGCTGMRHKCKRYRGLYR